MGLSSSAATYSDKTKKDIDAAIAEPLAVFSASYCPYCRRTKGMLKDYEPYKIIEVDQIGNGQLMPEYKAYLSEVTGASRITWPRVFIGGKLVGGCDDTTALQKNGQLQKLITQARNPSDSKL